MSGARITRYVVAALFLFAGAWLLSRSKGHRLSEPARYAHRIAGTMALAGGACLAVFASIFFTAVTH